MANNQFLPDFLRQPQQPIWSGGQGMGAGMMRIPPTPVQPIGTQENFIAPNDGGGDGQPTQQALRSASTPNAAEIAAGLTPLAGQRVEDSLLSSVGKSAAKNVANTATQAGITGELNLGGLMNPKGLMSAIPKAMFSGMGLEAPKNIGGFISSKLPAAASMLLGLGGAPGLAVGLMGTPLADVLGDALGFRDSEEAREKLEDVSGEIRGRSQYQDAIGGNRVTDTSLADSIGDFRKAAEAAEVRTKANTSIDAIQAAMNQKNAYDQLAQIIEFGTLPDTATMDARQRIQSLNDQRQASMLGMDVGELNQRKALASKYGLDSITGTGITAAMQREAERNRRNTFSNSGGSGGGHNVGGSRGSSTGTGGGYNTGGGGVTGL